MKTIIVIILLIAIAFVGYNLVTMLSDNGFKYDQDRGIVKTDTLLSVKSPFSGKNYSIEKDHDSDIQECMDFVLDMFKKEEP